MHLTKAGVFARIHYHMRRSDPHAATSLQQWVPSEGGEVLETLYMALQHWKMRCMDPCLS